MNRNIEDISFDDIPEGKYEKSVNEINNMLDNLLKDKKIRKAYQKILKMKEKENNKITYNTVNNFQSYNKIIECDKVIELPSKKGDCYSSNINFG